MEKPVIKKGEIWMTHCGAIVQVQLEPEFEEMVCVRQAGDLEPFVMFTRSLIYKIGG